MAYTNNRAKVLQWLSRVDPHSARLYESAIRLAEDSTLPCRGRLIAHAYREICSGLMNLHSSNSREELNPLLDVLVDEFGKLDLAIENIGAPTEVSSSQAEAIDSVPRTFTKAVRDVVDFHKAPPRARDRARAVISGLASDPSAGKLGVSQSANRWFEMYNYFVRCAHDRTTDDQVMMGDEFKRAVAFLEETLLAFVEEATANLDALDEILEQANA